MTTIGETPTAIDPETLVPKQLAKHVTVTFNNEPLKKVVAWIEMESGMKVSMDYRSLASSRLIETEPVTESLDDLPLYILLNRIHVMGIGWYVDGDVLYVTSRSEAAHHETTLPYPVGDFLDAGVTPEKVVRITSSFVNHISQDNDSSRVNLIGDVMFVRHVDRVQLEVAGLLAALRHPARRTFTFESPQHELLRKALKQPVTVDYKDTAFAIVIEELARQTKAPIRFDHQGLASGNIRERVSVSLKVSDQSLRMALDALQSLAHVGWYLQDDVLWITAESQVQYIRKGAVFDVRDLCSNSDEASALKTALIRQARYKWGFESPFGYLESFVPGILIARHTELALDELSELLESYRSALRVSKLRDFAPAVPDPAEVVTGYYRLPSPMARDLKVSIRRLIEPESWKSEAAPQAVGEIFEIAADAKGATTQSSTDKDAVRQLTSENVVLVIKQSRSVHQQIGKLIRLLNGSTLVDRDATAETMKKPKSTTVNFGSQITPAEIK